VTLTAASVTEPAAQAAARITVPSVAVTVAPNPVTVPLGEETQVTATVIGDPTDSGVTWVLMGCADALLDGGCSQPLECTSCGTISNAESASGIPISYTAPASWPPGYLTLTATSVANPLASTVVLVHWPHPRIVKFE